MNVFSFLGLMRSIYGKKLPDLDHIQDKGLLAVKIAQHFALRVDFLEPDVCRHLSKLFTNARPGRGLNGKELLRKYVDDKWFDNFLYFEEIPFTAASIGQVHYGTLRNGDKVVIKVIKEDFRDDFLNDLKILRKIIRTAIFFYPKLRKVFDPLSILKHIEQYTLSELDLKNEIEGMETLQKIVAKYKNIYDLSKLRFPKFYKELSNSKVLVSGKIEGETFDKKLTDRTLTYEMLLLLFQIHGLFLFAEGTFHGDLHPGNIIFGNDYNVYFIDTGALSYAIPKMNRGLFRFFTALSQYDYDRCVDYLNEMADRKIEDSKLERFRERFLELYKDFKHTTVSQVSLTKKMMDSIKLAVHSGMEFDQGMFPIIKSLMYLDGMVLRCKPDAVLIEDMRGSIDAFKEVMDSDSEI